MTLVVDDLVQHIIHMPHTHTKCDVSLRCRTSYRTLISHVCHHHHRRLLAVLDDLTFLMQTPSSGSGYCGRFSFWCWCLSFVAHWKALFPCSLISTRCCASCVASLLVTVIFTLLIMLPGTEMIVSDTSFAPESPTKSSLSHFFCTFTFEVTAHRLLHRGPLSIHPFFRYMVASNKPLPQRLHSWPSFQWRVPRSEFAPLP